MPPLTEMESSNDTLLSLLIEKHKLSSIDSAQACLEDPNWSFLKNAFFAADAYLSTFSTENNYFGTGRSSFLSWFRHGRHGYNATNQFIQKLKNSLSQAVGTFTDNQTSPLLNDTLVASIKSRKENVNNAIIEWLETSNTNLSSRLRYAVDHGLFPIDQQSDNEAGTPPSFRSLSAQEKIDLKNQVMQAKKTRTATRSIHL